MENLLTLIQNLAVWAYGAVFVMMLLENLGLPLPGQTVALVAAIVAGQGKLNFELIYLLTVIGGCLGSIGSYWIGRRGGHKILNRYGHFIFVTQARIEYAELFFLRHGYKTLLISRYLPVLCFASGLISGITMLEIRRFLFGTLLGMILWSTTHLTMGFLLGNSLDLLSQALNGVSFFVILLVIVIVIINVIRKKRINRNKKKLEH